MYDLNILQVALGLIKDIELRIYVHNLYGKGFMKECRVSPDAYIQMALQLAYYRVSFNNIYYLNYQFFQYNLRLLYYTKYLKLEEIVCNLFF